MSVDKITAIHPMLKSLYCVDQTQVEMMLAQIVNPTSERVEGIYPGPPSVLTFTRLLFGDPDVDAKPKLLYCVTSDN